MACPTEARPAAETFAKTLRKYYPVRLAEKSGGGVDVDFLVWRGGEWRRHRLIGNMPAAGLTEEALAAAFWPRCQRLSRELGWHGWPGG